MVIKANASGIPAIMIDCKDNATRGLIEKERDGFVCQLDENKITGKIIRIIANRLIEKMYIECLLTAGKYNWNKVVGMNEEINK